METPHAWMWRALTVALWANLALALAPLIILLWK
jgi:hypothetical protein